MHFSTLLSATALAAPALAGYVLEDDYMTDFYGHFDFFTEPDPTHGFVQYVDESTSRSMNLINASTTVPVEWGVDTVNKDQAGRASMRLTSKKSYNKGLVVMDVQHMPFGCGTWPAFWMVGPDWPNAGEIDILEGVHEQDTNAITLHTSSGCSIGDDHSVFKGDVDTSNCDIKAANQDENKGCSIKQKDTKSYGAGLNGNGGGVFATEWTSDAISVYFFPRGEVPDGILGDSPDPSSWGTPSAKFMNSGCNIDQYFKDQQIVFDTTFCGDWAGNTWSSSTCGSKAPTCNDYVRDNPEAFSDAFWTVNALKVYTNNGDGPKTSSVGAPGESSAISVPNAESSEVPVPSATDVPPVAPTVEPPKESSDASAPSSTGFESPPIIDPSEVPGAPSENPTPSAPAETGNPWAPGGTWGGPQIGQPTQGPGEQVAQAGPNADDTDSPMSGFQWPQGNGEGAAGATPTTAAAAANQTDLEVMPTFGDETTPAVPTPTTGPGPDDVVETVYQTVVVTVSPGETPAPGSRMGRHARAHRRRMVQHNGRK